MAAYFISSVTKYDKNILAVAGLLFGPYPPSPFIMQPPDYYIQFWDVNAPSIEPTDEPGAIGQLLWHLDYKTMGFSTTADARAAGKDFGLITSMVKFRDFMFLAFQDELRVGGDASLPTTTGTVNIWRIDPRTQTASPVSILNVPLRPANPGPGGKHGIQSIAIDFPYLMVYSGGSRPSTLFIAAPNYMQELRIYRMALDPENPAAPPTFTLMQQADTIGGPLRDFTEVPLPPAPRPWSNLTDRYTSVAATSTLEALPNTPEWDIPNHTEI